MTSASIAVNESLESLVAEVADEFLRRQRDGERPDVEEYAARYPRAAELLRKVLAALAVVGLSQGGAAADAGELGEPVAGTLGDFRIVRHIGQGGMGVVYEAEQISLRRRVALKVLPLAATMDPRQLQRFHNEAQAAACLHHGHIVPVFYVGCERGVHFYAMQLIEGQTLAAVIRELRRDQNEPEALATGSGRAPVAGVELAGEGEPPTVPHVQRPSTTAETVALASLSTEGRRRGREYYRKVAELGVQAAEALDYAHERGVIHRDVKPGNLMLDGHGALWVTDFGLAHLQHVEGSLTITGDLVGTLRYMSPEQALGKRVVVDHRTDVYSLGVTLYELLTLQPAFKGQDRQELLRQVACEEPIALRKLDRGIPTELETIVLKAMEKNPQDRYAAAQEMADDLRRWLEDRPIKARRPSLQQVAAKWARRHRPVVWAVAAVLLVAAILGGGNWLWWLQKRAGAEGQARAGLQEAIEWQEEERWPEALSAVRRAKGALAGVWADSLLREQVDEQERDVEMALRLQEARLKTVTGKDEGFDAEPCLAAYVDAFQWYGLDVESLGPQEAGQFILSRSIPMQLTAALDHWASLRLRLGGEGWRHLLAVSRVADPDPWRDRLRDAMQRLDPRAPEKLATSARGDELSPTTAVLLAWLTNGTPAAERALIVLQQVRQRHPGDFWVNHDLGVYLSMRQPPRLEEAIRYYSAAVALRPRSPGVHFNLAIALQEKGLLEEAIAEYREAIRLKKDYATAHSALGTALSARGLHDEAITECRIAIELEKGSTSESRRGAAHARLGIALHAKGKLAEAIAEFQEAIRLNKKNAKAHDNLGVALTDKDQLDDAIAEHRLALGLEKNLASAHYNLGRALLHKGRPDDAIAEWRKVLQLMPDHAPTHAFLGIALNEKGLLDDAIAEFREAVRLNKDFAVARSGLASTLKMAQVQGSLSAVQQGKAQPKDARERLAFGDLCQQPFRQQYAASARFYEEAFAAEPKLAENLSSQPRYNAACAAALAGCGQGKDADQTDDKERGRLRGQALAWLRADLVAYRQLLEKEPVKARPVIVQKMRYWQEDTDFAGVRAAALARLPEGERRAWQQLWADVAATLARAHGKATPTTNPRVK